LKKKGENLSVVKNKKTQNFLFLIFCSSDFFSFGAGATAEGHKKSKMLGDKTRKFQTLLLLLLSFYPSAGTSAGSVWHSGHRFCLLSS